MPRPPFADGRRGWRKRSSKARSKHGEIVYYDPNDDYEYEKEPNPNKRTWHRIDYRADQYQEIDRDTGEPVTGGEGEWHHLR